VFAPVDVLLTRSYLCCHC